MTFRPYPGLTIACALLLAALCGLGVWQLQRLHWKLGLIAQVDANMKAPPLTLDQVLALPPDKAQYHRVTVYGGLMHGMESYVFTTGEGGAPVYHVLTPLYLTRRGGWIMVDRGIVPKEKLDPATRQNLPPGPRDITGVWRLPDPPGFFTPPHKPGSRIWYSRDLKAMADSHGIRLKAPALLEADAAPNPGGWPKGGQTVVSFRNAHLSYAVTWFGLAAGLLGVWLAYHISKGRIAFK